MSDLLPSNSTPLEKALSKAIKRAFEVPVGIADLWNADNCPAALLPWLAWAYGLEAWKSYWPENVKRARVKAAYDIHRQKGTKQAVVDVVAAFGGSVVVQEWYEKSPAGTPGTFSILINVNETLVDKSVTADFQNDIIAEVGRVKPAYAHFTVTAGISAEGGMGLQGSARVATFRRLELQEA